MRSIVYLAFCVGVLACANEPAPTDRNDPSWFGSSARRAVRRAVAYVNASAVVLETRLLAWQIVDRRGPFGEHLEHVESEQFCRALVWCYGQKDDYPFFALVHIKNWSTPIVIAPNATTSEALTPDTITAWMPAKLTAVTFFDHSPSCDAVVAFLRPQMTQRDSAYSLFEKATNHVLKSKVELDAWNDEISDTIPKLW